MRNVVSCKEGSDQMGYGSSLATVGTKLKCVQSSFSVQWKRGTLSTFLLSISKLKHNNKRRKMQRTLG